MLVYYFAPKLLLYIHSIQNQYKGPKLLYNSRFFLMPDFPAFAPPFFPKWNNINLIKISQNPTPHAHEIVYSQFENYQLRRLSAELKYRGELDEPD